MKAMRTFALRRNSISLLILSFFLLELGGCGGSLSTKQPGGEAVRGVHVGVVRLERVPDEVEAPGTVASVRSAQVAARVMGAVLRIAVREGERVRQGQLLLALDEREFAARRSAAEADLREAGAGREEAAHAVAAAQAQTDVARKTYDRYVYLRDQKSVSPQEFDEVDARNRAAQAALQQALARKQQADAANGRAQDELRAAQTVANYARIVAPFDGIVVRRFVDFGSMAAPGTPLLVLEDASRYRLEATLDAKNAESVGRGDRARVALDAFPEKTFEASVAEIEAGADPASHTVQVKLDLPKDSQLRSGLFGRAWFHRGERQAVVVPRGALIERGQLRGVFLVDAGGIAHLRLVTLGASFGDRREVLSGLEAGEMIVIDPGGRELDGKRMEAER
jgi:membrane fusion protein, multidrug efflux system